MSWSQKIVENWWACIVAGVAVMILGFFERSQFLQLQSGEKKFLLVDPLTKIVYEIFGTGGVLFFWILLGLFMMGYGVYAFVASKR
ncbi:hypothetical protein BH10PLA1_BH10PLA1_12420 [soil metagenome]